MEVQQGSRFLSSHLADVDTPRALPGLWQAHTRQPRPNYQPHRDQQEDTWQRGHAPSARGLGLGCTRGCADTTTRQTGLRTTLPECVDNPETGCAFHRHVCCCGQGSAATCHDARCGAGLPGSDSCSRAEMCKCSAQGEDASHKNQFAAETQPWWMVHCPHKDPQGSPARRLLASCTDLNLATAQGLGDHKTDTNTAGRGLPACLRAAAADHNVGCFRPGQGHSRVSQVILLILFAAGLALTHLRPQG